MIGKAIMYLNVFLVTIFFLFFKSIFFLLRQQYVFSIRGIFCSNYLVEVLFYLFYAQLKFETLQRRIMHVIYLN